MFVNIFAKRTKKAEIFDNRFYFCFFINALLKYQLGVKSKVFLKTLDKNISKKF
jgi:hypothetical protein